MTKQSDEPSGLVQALCWVQIMKLELEWYEERARSLADPGKDDAYKEAVFTELTLDGGRRARSAMEYNWQGADGEPAKHWRAMRRKETLGDE